LLKRCSGHRSRHRDFLRSRFPLRLDPPSISRPQPRARPKTVSGARTSWRCTLSFRVRRLFFFASAEMSAIAECSALKIFGAYSPLFSVCIVNTGVRALSGVHIANAGVTGVWFLSVDLCSGAACCAPTLVDSRHQKRLGLNSYYSDTQPPPPCYAHQCQNKGVRSVHRRINIKTKDLARMKGSGQVKSFFTIFLRTDAK
jgi:hypothetical protein